MRKLTGILALLAFAFACSPAAGADVTAVVVPTGAPLTSSHLPVATGPHALGDSGSAPGAAAFLNIGTTSGTVAAGNDSRITGAGQIGVPNTWTAINTFQAGVTISGLNSSAPLANTILYFPNTTITDNDAVHGFHAWQDSTIVSTTANSAGYTSGLCNQTLTGAGSMINYECMISNFVVGAGYSGTMPVAAGWEWGSPVILNGGFYPSVLPFVVDPETNGNGITSGVATNYGFRVDAPTADAGVGGTVTNLNFVSQIGTGSAIGTTNVGFEVQGSCSGSATCFAFFSNSTDPSQLNGPLQMGGANITSVANLVSSSASGYQVIAGSCTFATTTVMFAPDRGDNTTGVGCNGAIHQLSLTIQGAVIESLSSTGATFNVPINKVTFTAPATGSTLTIADGKILTASNTLTFSGTDGSTLNVGAGGTLGSNAFTSTAYAPVNNATMTGTFVLPEGTSCTSSNCTLGAAILANLKNITGIATIQGNAVAGPDVLGNTTSTATAPTLVANRGSLTTGIGGASGNLDLIAGGADIARAASTGFILESGSYFAGASQGITGSTCTAWTSGICTHL